MSDDRIYHVCKSDDWKSALAQGTYEGSAQDKADGFIHFSGLDTVRASTAKHRAGQDHLTLLVVDTGKLGDNLKWEQSRGGLLFPHLYAALPVDAVAEAIDVRLGSDGVHVFPDHIPASVG
jgi:uncharacterized protein (DUF952 family)